MKKITRFERKTEHISLKCIYLTGVGVGGGGGEGEAEAVLIFARKDQLARRVTMEKQNRTYLKSWDAV